MELVNFTLFGIVCLCVGFSICQYAHYLDNKHKYQTYSHWDVHALARKLDPESWAIYDAAPEYMQEGEHAGKEKNYLYFPILRESFDTAVQCLLAGYRGEGMRLHSNADLQEYLQKEAIKAIKRKKF